MNLAFIVEVLETEEELATDDGNVRFGKGAGLEQIKTGSTC